MEPRSQPASAFASPHAHRARYAANLQSIESTLRAESHTVHMHDCPPGRVQRRGVHAVDRHR
eukprot:353871-Chlamydomonas_euryale.AAC.3